MSRKRGGDDIAVRPRPRDLRRDEILALVERHGAPRCMNAATPEVEYWIRFSITWPSAGGACSQPMRQPVIAQFFEKVLTKRMRSSAP